jgi:hypothetical protein
VGRDRLVPRLLSPAWRSRVTAEQNRKGWETVVRIEKILYAVLRKAHKRQIEETMEALREGTEGLYKQPHGSSCSILRVSPACVLQCSQALAGSYSGGCIRPVSPYLRSNFLGSLHGHGRIDSPH